ncbi:hypothetical protein D3C87_1190190 [compost metagenome]
MFSAVTVAGVSAGAEFASFAPFVGSVAFVTSAGLLAPGAMVGWIRSYSGSVAGAAAATGAAVGPLAGAEFDAVAVDGTVLADICGGAAT